jgi:hypothetical protein
MTRTAHNWVDLTGQRFNRLTVRAYLSGGAWQCECECGGSAVTTGTKLKSGHSKSCGCLKAERAANRLRHHGLMDDGHRHPLIDTYANMMSRCGNESDAAYDRYGGRGITVCDRWANGEDGKTGFFCFVEDMGPRLSRLHSLDRVDNNGPYSPENCRWATKKEQARNRRSNRTIEHDGRHIAISEYCERTGLNFQAVNSRLSKGWSIERAITAPMRRGGRGLCLHI